MALYTKKQFCELVGVKPKHLSTYISRGNIIAQGDFIDDTVEINKGFIDKRLQSQKKKLQADPPPEKKPAPKPPTSKKDIPSIPPPPEIDEEEIPDFTLDQLEKMAESKLDKEKKRLDILKAQEDLQVARIRKQKMIGEIVPVELVQDIFKQHFKDIDDAFNQGADAIATVFVKRLGGTRKHLSEIRSDLVAIINDKIAQATEASENEVKNIVKEYSEKRGPGNR